MLDKNRLSLIMDMEDRMNTTTELLTQVEDFLPTLRELHEHIQALSAYYTSPQWREDYDASNEGLIPADIPHGVLSQDGLYNLLVKYDALMTELDETFPDVDVTEEDSSDQ